MPATISSSARFPVLLKLMEMPVVKFAQIRKFRKTVKETASDLPLFAAFFRQPQTLLLRSPVRNTPQRGLCTLMFILTLV